jgi:predicted Zn finger-like uncharacterized protein
MIVQCQNCDTRFHVADARIPEKGARVRCSRCHHRFHITPSSGNTSSPNSGPDVSARTETRGEPTETRAEGGGGAAGSDELENPEFLFEGNSVTESDGRKASAPAEAEESEPHKPEPPPETEDRPSPDLEPAQAPEQRVVETSGATAQEMLAAGAPKLGRNSGPVEFAASLRDEDDDDTRSRFMLGDESTPSPSPAASREAAPSLRPAKDKDKPAAPPKATLTPIKPAPIPKPAKALSPKSEIDAAFGAGLSDEDDPDTGWDSLTKGEDEAAPQSVFDMGASFGLEGKASATAPAAAPAEPEKAKKKREAPSVSSFDPEARSHIGTIARAAAMLVGIALLAGTLRGLQLQRQASAASSEAEQAAGWIATDVETFVARDSLGQRVLVVRGNLFPNGSAPPPEVEVSLLESDGARVGDPSRALLERLDDAEIAPDALTVKLASSSGEISGMGPQVTGFTALLQNPPANARRVQVTLNAGKQPARGTATANTPAPNAPALTPPPGQPQLATPAPTVLVPAPAQPQPQLATPTPAQPTPAQVKPDAVVPAAPEPD